MAHQHSTAYTMRVTLSDGAATFESERASAFRLFAFAMQHNTNILAGAVRPSPPPASRIVHFSIIRQFYSDKMSLPPVFIVYIILLLYDERLSCVHSTSHLLVRIVMCVVWVGFGYICNLCVFFFWFLFGHEMYRAGNICMSFVWT